MSIEQQPTNPLKRDQVWELFELLIALDHNLIDLKFAMEKAWEAGEHALLQVHLLSAQGTINKACQLLNPESADH